MAHRKSNFDLEAQQIITLPQVDAPKDSKCLIIGIVTLVGLCAASLYGLRQLSATGMNITDLCNGYIESEEGKPSKIASILGKCIGSGYTTQERVIKETLPFLQTFVRHFQNNVNALGGFSEAEMELELKAEGLNIKNKVIISGSTPEEFLEELVTASQKIQASHAGVIKKKRLGNLSKLIVCLQSLGQAAGGGGGMMAEVMKMAQGMDEGPQKESPEVTRFKAMNPFEQKDRLQNLVDPDFYMSYGLGQQGQQIVGALQQMWPQLWHGKGSAMKANPEIVKFLARAQTESDDGGLLLKIYTQYKASKALATAGEVPYIAWVNSKTVILDITRGLIPQTTRIWNGKPLNASEWIKV